MTTRVVVSRDFDPESHADPGRRGGYLLLLRGRVPEIVLDGLCDTDDQAAAEQRCLRELEQHLASGRSTASARDGGPPEHSQSAREGTPRRSNGGRGELLGQRLVARGLLSPEELRRTLEQQSALPGDRPVRRLGSLLVEAGLLSMRQVADALGEQHGVQASSGSVKRLDAALQALFPRDLLVEIQAAPLCIVGKTVAVAMVDAHDRGQVQRLQALTEYSVRPMQAPQILVHELLQSIGTSAWSNPTALPPEFGTPASQSQPQRPSGISGGLARPARSAASLPPDAAPAPPLQESARALRRPADPVPEAPEEPAARPSRSQNRSLNRSLRKKTRNIIWVAGIVLTASLAASVTFLVRLHHATPVQNLDSPL